MKPVGLRSNQIVQFAKQAFLDTEIKLK